MQDKALSFIENDQDSPFFLYYATPIPHVSLQAPESCGDYLYWEFPSYGGQQAVRMDKWKGIRKNIKKEGNLDIELYNLEKDIREEQDVAEAYPNVIKKLKRL